MKHSDEALGELIKKGIEIAEQTGKFVIDQAPELIQQFYMWHIVQNTLGVFLGLLFFFVAYKVIKMFGEDESCYDTDCELFGKHIGFGIILTSALLVVFGSMFLILSGYELLFILTAPKLYLIEYFTK